jgi:hypothetical protein
MFAPKVPKLHAKDQHRPHNQSTGSMLPRSISDAYWRPLLPERSLWPSGNATRDQIDATPPIKTAPNLTGNFCQVPVSPPERVGRVEPPFPARAPRLPIQAKLKVGAVNDPLEYEADDVAHRVMRMPAPDVALTSAPAKVSRKCAACEEEDEKLRKKEAGTAGAAESYAPVSVHEVLRSPGEPLDDATRAYFEPRFGQDFSGVRVHTDSRAAQSAREVNAKAYTVGRNIVFAAGEYAPETNSGGRLLAHELAHTVQQGGNSVLLQRACVASPCPAVPEPIGAFFPRWEAAEKCIQNLYDQSHPAKRGVSLSFNVDWLHLSGGSLQEKLALGCLRAEETPGAGPNFTAKSGMYAAAPDIWDFRNQTMYEITTKSGAPERIAKLAFETGLASNICGPANCGGLQFSAGTWVPPSGCFALGGDLYFTANNTQGVIVYNLLRDAAKELALATLLALMAASMKQLGPKAGAEVAGKAVAGKALGKAVPAYAVASLAATVVLLASGRAEAKPGPGEEPLVTLFKALEQKGTPVPKEIQEMLEANPDLKEKLNAAMAKGGDPTKLQEELSKQILDTIAANKDKFTPEELELLLGTSQAAGKALHKGDVTVDQLKKAAAAKKAGKPGGVEEARPGEVSPPAPSAPPRAPAERLVEGMAKKEKEGPKFTPALKEKLLAAARAVTPPLTDKEVDELLTRLESAAGKSEEEIVDSVRKGVNTLRAAQGGKAVPGAPEPTAGAKKPEETSGRAGTADVAVKAKQGKKDPKLEADLEKKMGWLKAGESTVKILGNIVEDGGSYIGLVAGRDEAGDLYIGQGCITLKLVREPTWLAEVPAGIKLLGAAGPYGTTRRFSTEVNRQGPPKAPTKCK